jgi:hypothetical protein
MPLPDWVLNGEDKQLYAEAVGYGGKEAGMLDDKDLCIGFIKSKHPGTEIPNNHFRLN